MIFMWSLYHLGVIREVFIGKILKSFGYVWKISIEFTWFLEPTYPPLECLKHLRGMACLSCLEHLSGPEFLSALALLQKSISNHFKFKTKPILLIPQRSLIYYKLNLFRHMCDFSIGRTTTFDLQWRASHYIKRLLWPNIKKE